MTLAAHQEQDAPLPSSSVGAASLLRSGRRDAAAHGAVAALCLLLAALAVAHTSGAIPDDALITYRYAQNLLDGHGWVYNLHRPTTDAATAPLYTVLLVVGGFVVGSVTRAASVLFVLTTAGAGYLGFALLRRHGMSVGGVVAACLLIVNPWLLATRGMESSLFVSLLLLAALLLSMQRLVGAGAVLAVATFVRGDGAVVLAVAFVFLLVRLRRVPWRFVLGAAGAAVPWVVFATVVIGSPIPDTLGAKAAQGRSGLWGTGYVFVHGLSAIPQAFHFSGWAVALLVVGALGVPLVFVDRGLRGSAGPLVVGALLIFGVYGFVIKTPNYHWYYGPQVAAMALCGGVSTGFVVRWLGRVGGAGRGDVAQPSAGGGAGGGERTPATRVSAPWAAGVALALVAAVVVGGLGWRQTNRDAGLRHYEAVARWLKAHTPAGSSVAATEIGAVGWYSDRDMVDYLGLLSKASVDEVSHGDLISWLAREQPDYWIVHQPAWYFEPAVAEPWFALDYQPVWTDGTLAVWHRVRSVAQARSLESSVVEPAANELAARLSVSGSDTASHRALASLVALYATTPSLQSAYTHGGRLDVQGILAWAGGSGPSTVAYGAGVERDGALYQALAAKTAGSKVGGGSSSGAVSLPVISAAGG